MYEQREKLKQNHSKRAVMNPSVIQKANKNSRMKDEHLNPAFHVLQQWKKSLDNSIRVTPLSPKFQAVHDDDLKETDSNIATSLTLLGLTSNAKLATTAVFTAYDAQEATQAKTVAYPVDKVNAPTVNSGLQSAGGKTRTTQLEEAVPDKVRYIDLPNDLVADSRGVYGYLPTSDSQFHSSKWPVDWTNVDQVSAARTTRRAYHAGLKKKQEFINTLRLEGTSDDDIARQIIEMRNQDRLSHYKTPEALEVVYKRNFVKYGNKMGPTYESQIAKYGTSTEVINAALRSNDTMDVLTGMAKPK